MLSKVKSECLEILFKKPLWFCSHHYISLKRQTVQPGHKVEILGKSVLKEVESEIWSLAVVSGHRLLD